MGLVLPTGVSVLSAWQVWRISKVMFKLTSSGVILPGFKTPAPAVKDPETQGKLCHLSVPQFSFLQIVENGNSISFPKT